MVGAPIELAIGQLLAVHDQSDRIARAQGLLDDQLVDGCFARVVPIGRVPVLELLSITVIQQRQSGDRADLRAEALDVRRGRDDHQLDAGALQHPGDVPQLALGEAARDDQRLGAGAGERVGHDERLGLRCRRRGVSLRLDGAVLGVDGAVGRVGARVVGRVAGVALGGSEGILADDRHPDHGDARGRS